VDEFPVALVEASDAGTGLRFVLHRGVELYIKSALRTYLADSINGNGDDTAVLLRIVDAVRARVLNSVQVAHPARTWSSLATGYGYCDQINAVVAGVAAHHFPRAQIYALYDAKNKTSPHTIGRVWSESGGGWLYFDAFYDIPVIFRRRTDGAIDFVVKSGLVMPSRSRPAFEFYRLQGWVMNEYARSVGGQIGIKIANRFGWGDIEPGPDVSGDPMPPVWPTPSVDAAVFERVARAYMAARIDHVLSGVPDLRAYQAIASDTDAWRDSRAAEFVSAARVFATSQ
jgi:hypothetical protein